MDVFGTLRKLVKLVHSASGFTVELNPGTPTANRVLTMPDQTSIISTSADLSAHTSATSVHGATGNLFGLGDNPQFTSTGSIKVPTGTTAERPGSPATGQVRFNTTTSKLETYNGSTWISLESTAPTNIVRLQGGNGRGSTNTAIRRFSTTIQNTGTAITYADSATNGATFTINEDGNYVAYYMDVSGGADDNFGISLNSNQLTTSIDGITNTHRLGNASALSGGSRHTVSVPFTAVNGDVVRAQCGTNFGTNSDSNCGFTIMKVSG